MPTLLCKKGTGVANSLTTSSRRFGCEVGNLRQPHPNTPPTQFEAHSMLNHSAEDRDEIKPVELTGGTTPNCQITYTLPTSGMPVTSEITGFFNVNFRVTEPDGSSTTVKGGLVQMAHGDMFFHPAADSVADWANIDKVQSVTAFPGTSPLPAASWLNTTRATVTRWSAPAPDPVRPA